MSDLKATPGPWARVVNKFGESVLVQPATDRTLFLLDDGETTDWNQDETDANARLIAAAPDLYEALDNAPLPSTLGNREDHYQRFYDWFNKVAQPALDKARGRQ